MLDNGKFMPLMPSGGPSVGDLADALTAKPSGCGKANASGSKGHRIAGGIVGGLIVGAGVGGASGGAEAAAEAFEEGSFSIIDWTGYPAGMPRPTGPVRILTGEEYAAARALADETNAAIRAANNLEGTGLHIHEIQPVKFGGSPTDLANKTLLPAAEHVGPQGVHPQFWNPLLRWATGG